MNQDFTLLKRFRSFSHRDQGFNYSSKWGMTGVEMRYDLNQRKRRDYYWATKSYSDWAMDQTQMSLTVALLEIDAAKEEFREWFSLGNLRD